MYEIPYIISLYIYIYMYVIHYLLICFCEIFLAVSHTPLSMDCYPHCSKCLLAAFVFLLCIWTSLKGLTLFSSFLVVLQYLKCLDSLWFLFCEPSLVHILCIIYCIQYGIYFIFYIICSILHTIDQMAYNLFYILYAYTHIFIIFQALHHILYNRCCILHTICHILCKIYDMLYIIHCLFCTVCNLLYIVYYTTICYGLDILQYQVACTIYLFYILLDAIQCIINML